MPEVPREAKPHRIPSSPGNCPLTRTRLGQGKSPLPLKQSLLALSRSERPPKMKIGSSQREMFALRPLCPAQDTEPGPARAG